MGLGQMMAIAKAAGGLAVPTFTEDEEGNWTCDMTIADVLSAVANKSCICAWAVFDNDSRGTYYPPLLLTLAYSAEHYGQKMTVFQGTLSEGYGATLDASIGILEYQGHTQIFAQITEKDLSGRPVIISVPGETLNNYEMDALPTIYDFGEKTSLKLFLGWYMSGIDTEYKFMFTCPSGAATTLTLPDITGKVGDFTLQAGKSYLVDVIKGTAFFKEYEVTAV